MMDAAAAAATTTTTPMATTTTTTTTNDISNALEATHLTTSTTTPATTTTSTIPKMIPLPSYLPTTLSRSYEIYEIITDCWVQIFQDRIVIGVTQMDQKIGHWCLCQALQSPTDPKAIDYSISSLLGSDSITNPLIGVYARQLTERLIASSSTKTALTKGKASLQVLLGISLLSTSTSSKKGAGNDKNNESKKEIEERNQKIFRVLIPVLIDLVNDALSS